MAVKRYNGTSWDTVAGLGAQGAAATSSSITTWVKTASGGETSLTGSSDSSTTLAYTPGQEQFFINGVLQVRGSDYTATNGTSITGLTALTAGDIATVTTVNAFSVTGAVPLSTVTANGDLIVGTSSGAVGRLGVGSTGNVLTVSGGVPTWAAPAGGGKVLQVVYATNGTQVNNATTNFVDTGLSASITPSSTSSKVLIFVNQRINYYRSTSAQGGSLKILRSTTDIYQPGGNSCEFTNITGATNVEMKTVVPIQYLDSPNTTSSTTYKLQGRPFATSSSGEIIFQASGDQSSIVLIEIGA
jgi:hypothetical protein